MLEAKGGCNLLNKQELTIPRLPKLDIEFSLMG